MNVAADWGVLFDWDGVIVDSSSAHELSWERLASLEKKTLPSNHFKKGFGKKNESIIPDLLGWTSDLVEISRLSLLKEKLYRDIVREQGLRPLPGVLSLVKTLTEAAIPFAIASSTHRENILSVLDVIGLPGSFVHIVSSEDVGQGKPHPEVFLKAAGKIRRPPERCIVFEDTPVGLEAAHRGGMKAVGVLTSHPREKLTEADVCVERLDALGLAELRALLDTPRETSS